MEAEAEADRGLFLHPPPFLLKDFYKPQHDLAYVLQNA